ncbi:hypothetical protein GGI11_008395, partial [Coemansia sp. RSA 2049]
AGVRRRRDDDEDDGGCEGDSTSEFSIQLDLKHHGEKLDIPRDLKLEFDEALSAADATPPGSSSHGLSLDMQSFASHLSDSVCTTHVDSSNANIGLNVLIPAQDTKGQNAKSTWDSTSPDYDTAKQQHLLLRSSADSLASSTPDILLDIARELGEGEPFGSPTQTSLLHVDDGDMSHHLSQLSLLGRSQISPIFPSFDHVFSGIRESERSPEHSNIRQEPGRTLPPLPPHTRSLNYGGGGDKQAVSTTEAAPTASTLQNASRSRTFASNSHGANRAHAGGRSRIPHPPSSRYNLQQQQGVAAQSTTTYSNSDYRRLPSLPPR